MRRLTFARITVTTGCRKLGLDCVGVIPLAANNPTILSASIPEKRGKALRVVRVPGDETA